MSFFGSNTTSQPSAFGAASKPTFAFGNTNTSTTSTAGFGFGTTTSSGFGTTPSTGFTGFGAPAASTATPFGSLGVAPASTAPSLFGAGFGNTAAKPATGFGTGFGTNTFGTNNAFGTGSTFGTSQPAPAFGTNTLGSNAFGTTNTLGGNTFGTTNTLGGNTFGTTNTLGGNTFGTTNTLGGNTFGTTNTFGTNALGNFGVKPNTGFGGFGTGLGTGLGTGMGTGLGTNQFGQPQQQQQQQQLPATAQEALVAAVFNCCVFGDERDEVLAKWNLLQAKWGTGQAYYNRNAPALELNEQNPLCRFKAVGYSVLSGKEDKEGHVAMLFNKTEQEMKNNQQGIINALQGLLGNKPNLAVSIESVKAVSESKCQIEIYVVDKNAGNSHVAASELSAFLNSGNARAALAAAGCNAAAPVTKPSPQALAQYLSAPPAGIDMRLWKQAQADNPDPANYIPMPIVGFSEIKFRARCQAEQARLLGEFLKKTDSELAELRTRRAASSARLTQLAARHHQLRHTLLQVIARQEVVGRVGAALSPEEEETRARLHELAAQLSTPPLYNGRLNEMLCAVRLQRSASAGAPQERYHLDPGAQEDVKQFLSMQQRGMAHLLDTARKDLAALNIIAEGMSKLVRA